MPDTKSDKPEAETTKAESAQPSAAPPQAPPAPVDFHAAHAELVARETVTLVKPKRVTKFGRVFPEVTRDVVLTSAKCAVVHRVLHSLSPDEHKALEKRFDARAPKVDPSKRADELEKFKVHFIASSLGKLPTSGSFAIGKRFAPHVTHAALAAHRATLAKALASAST